MNEIKIPSITSETELCDFLDSFEGNLKKLHTKMSNHEFKQLVEKTKIPEIGKLQKEYASLISNPFFKEIIYNWVEQVNDPTLNRRLTLWKNQLDNSQIHLHPEILELTKELSDEMITYQYMVGNDESDLGTIKNILRTSPDSSLRKKAWLGKVAISEHLAPRLIKLIQLRNDLAKELGYPTYADYSLKKIDGLSLEQVRNILTNLTEQSNLVYHQILEDGKKKLGLNKIEPWDLMYLLEEMGEINSTLFPKTDIENDLKKWALTHGTNLENLGIEMVCTDIPYNGLCMTLGENKIKILTNPSDGHNSYRTMFHEMGHALHSAFISQKSLIFRNDSGIFNEGMAEVLAYVTRHPEWLKERGFDSSEVLQFQKRLIAPWFHYIRERTAYSLAEYLIYENPGQDADSILAQIEHNILGITLDHTPRWAASAWYIKYPVYWQNYILADLIASQIHEKFNQKFSGLHQQPEAFKELCQVYFAPGSLIDWQEKILNHTGSKLKADALVKDLNLYLK